MGLCVVTRVPTRGKDGGMRKEKGIQTERTATPMDTQPKTRRRRRRRKETDLQNITRIDQIKAIGGHKGQPRRIARTNPSLGHVQLDWQIGIGIRVAAAT
jgi:hypothetical protein